MSSTQDFSENAGDSTVGTGNTGNTGNANNTTTNDGNDITNSEATTNNDATANDNSFNASERPGEGRDTLRALRHWTRAVDALVARELDARFAEAGASRRDLRVLSMLSGERQLPDAVRSRLERHGRRLWSLADRGWIERTDASPAQGRVDDGDTVRDIGRSDSGLGWQLTEAGEAARLRLREISRGVRERAAGAVTPADLDTTIETLEAIARELGWTEGMRLPRGGRGHSRGHGRGHERGLGREHGRGHGRGQGRGHGYEWGQDRGHERGHGRGHERGHNGGPREDYVEAHCRTHDGTHDRTRDHAHDHAHHDRGFVAGREHAGWQARSGRRVAYERGFSAGFVAARDGA